MDYNEHDAKTLYYRYENVKIESETLPIKICLRKSNSNSFGCEFHWHEELEFYFVKKGAVLLQCNEKQKWIHKGEVGFVNWCQLHRGISFLDNTEHYIIQIGTKFFSEETISVSRKQQHNYLSMLISHCQQFPLVFTDCRNIAESLEQIILLQSEQISAYQLKLKAAVYNLLAYMTDYVGYEKLSKSYSSDSLDLISLNHVKNILLFLSANYMNSDLVTLTKLSRRFGLSVPYICRIFKQYTDMTVIAYIQQLRCSSAAALIRNGISLEQAAYLTGFQDYNYFSRIFKKIIGIPPVSYKKKQKEMV